MSSDANVAVCFSGYTQISANGNNLLRTLTRCFGAFDSFWFLPSDHEQDSIERLFQPKRLIVEPDKLIDAEHFPTDTRLKTGLQAFLQQIHGWQSANALRKQYEADSGKRYEFVVRCRPDIYFRSRLPPLHRINPDRITVPAFHSWGGYNDRFAIGNRMNMDILMNFFGFICDNPHSLSGSVAEKVFKRYLDSNQIRVEKIRKIRFDRIRYTSGKHVVLRDTNNVLLETLRDYRDILRKEFAAK